MWEDSRFNDPRAPKLLQIGRRTGNLPSCQLLLEGGGGIYFPNYYDWILMEFS